MDLLIGNEGDTVHLHSEIRRGFPAALVEEHGDGSLLFVKGLPRVPTAPLAPVFLRQMLPVARRFEAETIRGWAEQIGTHLISDLEGNPRWRLHVLPHYPGDRSGIAGTRRCELIHEAVVGFLRHKRRSLLRQLEDGDGPFTPEEALAQLLLTAPNQGFLSIAPPSIPHLWRRWISAFPKGSLPVASDKAAPSRAFAKLVEAERRLGFAIGSGETCADLGASPGSWSYVALQRGARVFAVDRAPLRSDLMNHPGLTFQKGDAFRFEPESRVDWLLCDVIAAPERSIGLLLNWLDKAWCRHFVVTIKFLGSGDYQLLDGFKRELATRCGDFLLTRLCANRNEACAAGRM